MPDLDQIKQVEQGIRAGPVVQRPLGNPAFKLSSPINGASHHAF